MANITTALNAKPFFLKEPRKGDESITFDKVAKQEVIGERHSETRNWRRAMTAGAALFATVVGGNFLLQNYARHDSALQGMLSTTTTVVGQISQISVAVPKANQGTHATAASTEANEVPQTLAAASNSKASSSNLKPAFPARAEEQIEAVRAPFHIGESVVACGKVAQVSVHSGVTYHINSDRLYPNQMLALVIWQSELTAL